MPRKPKAPKRESSRVRLDWRAYFVEFCMLHGEPIEVKGRLLFRDGWQYSATEYEGPEFPPPPNNLELDALILQYWIHRRTTLSTLVTKLIHDRELFKKAQETRSALLQQVTFVDDEDRRRKSYKPLDMKLLDSKISWIQSDLEECEIRVREIEAYNKQRVI